MLFLCCLYVVSMLFLCCFDFVEIYYEKLVSQQFTRKPTNFFNYIDFIQKLNLVDLQTQGSGGESRLASTCLWYCRQIHGRAPSRGATGNPCAVNKYFDMFWIV